MLLRFDHIQIFRDMLQENLDLISKKNPLTLKLKTGTVCYF